MPPALYWLPGFPGTGMGKVRIGISGWRYKPWRGRFYPDDLPQRRELAYAAERFSSIELNGSFYALQRPERYAAWYEQTPRGFVFAVKAPRYITHVRRLRDAHVPLANFFASGLFELREKLGPLLWQLPPSFRFDPERLEAFLAELPRDTEQASALAHDHDDHVDAVQLQIDRNHRLRHALEVRHESFVDAAFVRLLRRYGVALVVTDSGGKWPYLEDVTAGFMYLRLHGAEELYASGYDDAALDSWAGRIRAWRRGGQPGDAVRQSTAQPPPRKTRDVYCYFDNDAKVRAPHDAQSLARRLGDAGG